VKPRYGSHYVASTQVTQRLVQRSFSWMFVGLTLTALVAIVLSMNPEVPKMLVQNQAVFYW
jgi:FtsH-binding integral membrane protein